MFINIEVNNKTIKARKGETILSALRRGGMDVPTLCHMKDFRPSGACRLCMVEMEGRDDLVPACSYPVEEWIKINTHSPRVLKARRTIVELLLANHPDDCLYCDKNMSCELQNLAEELHIHERRFPGKRNRYRLDQSSSSLVRDPSKCILCGRCVRTCEEVQSVSAIDFVGRGNKMVIETAMSKSLNLSSCIHCGQCIMVCPTGALHEKNNYDEVLDALYDNQLHVVVQYAPSISVSIAEEFGIRPGKEINALLNAALRKMGFEKIFLTSFGADLASMEGAAEFENRLEHNMDLPMFSSCCPSWIKYMEQFWPQYLHHLSTCKSPQQMLGTLIKSYYSEVEEIPHEKLFSVAIMPCTSKKFEAQRAEMNQKGIPDIDVVLTTRELIKMIRLNGIDIASLEGELPDQPFGTRSSSGKIFATSGGMSESVIRSLSREEKIGMDTTIEFGKGNKDVKIVTRSYQGKELRFAIVNGLREAKNLMQSLSEGKLDYDFVEVMACESGCIAGGGQPYNNDEKIHKQRVKSLHETDAKDMIKVPYRNPAIKELFDKYFDYPGSEKSRKLLHTGYSPKETLI